MSRAIFSLFFIATLIWLSSPVRARADSSSATIERALEKGPRPKVVLSFAKHESRLEALCAALERDGRKERVAIVSTFGAKNAYECGSCRVLWKTLERVCRVKEPPKEKTKKKKKGAPEAEEPAPTPTPTPTPTPLVKQRYPSPEVIDVASRLSTSMYERERDGMMKESVDRITDMLERYGEPTPGEREYFGILRSYLMAAWAGRETTEASAAPLPAPDESED